jgi:hypothetical protein
VTKARKVAQLIETLKQRAQAKPKESEGMKKLELPVSKIGCLRKTPKNFREMWAQRMYRPEDLHLWQK